MKRILSATIGAALLLTSASGAAMARPYGGHGGGYSHSYGHGGYRGNGGGAMIAAGIGILGLAAILSSQNHRDDYYGEYGPPPPPPPARYGYDRYNSYDGYDGR